MDVKSTVADVPLIFDVRILALIGVGIVTFEPTRTRSIPAVANETFPLEGRYIPLDTSVMNASEGPLTLPEGMFTLEPMRMRSIPAVANETFPLDGE